MKISAYLYPNGIIVTECGREDLGFSQAEVLERPLSLLNLSPTFTMKREIRATEIWSGDGKGSVEMNSFLGEWVICFSRSVVFTM